MTRDYKSAILSTEVKKKLQILKVERKVIMKNIRYLIKITTTVRENNKNYLGCVSHYVYGKNQKMLASDSKDLPDMSMNLSNYLVKEYGYKREDMAKRASKFWEDLNKEENRFCDRVAEVISVEI